MKNMRIYLIALCALALSGGSILLSGSPASLAQSGGKDVVVTNTTANPVPVAVQGTASIAGSVSVSNTPNVNVANSPTVQLNNSASNPLLVRDVDNPARQAFQNELLTSFQTGGIACFTIATVPSGKRLVIEYVSEYINLSGSDRVMYRSSLRNSFQGSPNYLGHTLDFQRTTSNSFRVAQQLRLYADSGQVDLCVENDVGAPGSVLASISGYFVDVPE